MQRQNEVMLPSELTPHAAGEAPPPPPEPVSTAAEPPAELRRMWCEGHTLYAFGNQHRRQMFYLIAREPAGFTIEQMAGRVRRKRSVTGKHLEIMRRSEIVTVERRGRASVHVLHPDLRAQPDAPEWLNFGFMILQIPKV